MGLFDTLKVMKDIVKGGVAAYQAEEKLDELIARIREEYLDELAMEEKALRAEYKAAKKELEEKEGGLGDDDKRELQKDVMDKKLAYLAAVARNPALPEAFREEIESAVGEYKRAENLALDSLEDTLVKAAETDEDREKVKETLAEMKRK